MKRHPACCDTFDVGGTDIRANHYNPAMSSVLTQHTRTPGARLGALGRPMNSPGALVLMICAIILGVGIGIAIIPTLFRAMPTDLTRYQLILRTLEDATDEPRTVVFGSSITMSGVDARLLTKDSPNLGLAYNLSSSGQTLVESYLLYQELPESVQNVVQLVSAKSMANSMSVHVNRYNAIYMYGYRPDPETIAFLKSQIGEEIEETIGASDLVQRFRARRALRGFIEMSARKLLRGDLSLDRAHNDLYYPSPYNLRLQEPRRQALLDGDSKAWPYPTLYTQQEKVAVVEQMAKLTRDRGIRLALLLPPIHPLTKERLGPGYLDAFKGLINKIAMRHGAVVIDVTDLLDDSQFIDHIHPTDEGAAVLTAFIAGRI